MSTSALPPDLLEQAVHALHTAPKGFHQVDGWLSRWLVTRPASQWSPSMRRKAWLMTQKYEMQLGREFGIQWRRIEEPLAPPIERAISDDKLVSCNGTGWLLRYPFDEETNLAVRMIPGSKWKGDLRAYWVPYTLSNAERISSLAYERGFLLLPETEEKMREIAEQAAERVEASRAGAASFHVEGLGGTLLPYQQAGVRYLAEMHKALLADEMGLGKTIQALAAVQALEAWPAAVVCPASLLLNWEAESLKWLPGITVKLWTPEMVVPAKKKRAPKKANSDRVLHVVSYNMVAKHLAGLKAQGLKAVVFDEIHYCKDGKAKRTLACKQLAQRVPVRFGLSGTPMLNSHEELIPILQIIGRLEEMGGFWDFVERYCGAKKAGYGWNFSRSTNGDELNDKLRATCYLRRLKSEVLTELPPKRRSMVPVEIDNREEYNRAQADVVEWMASESVSKAKLDHLPEAEQAAKRHIGFLEKVKQLDGMEMLLRFEALKKLAARGKLAQVKAWIRCFCESGEKLIVFAHHREIVTAIYQEFLVDFGAVMIIGGMEAEEKQAAVERFQTNRGCFLIVLSLQAGGVGLNLTASSNVAVVEQGWTSGAMDQAEDRAHRIGQRNAVNIHYLMARGTVDPEIYQIIEDKRALCVAASGDTRDLEEQRTAAARSLAAAMNPFTLC